MKRTNNNILAILSVFAFAGSSFGGTPGPIAHYLVSAATTQLRGTPFSVTVIAQDTNNNTVTTDSSTLVTLSNSTRNVLFDGSGDGSFRGNTVILSGGTFTVNASDNIGENVTIYAIDAKGTNGTSSAVTIKGLAGDYRSVNASGNWDEVGSWETWNGSDWAAAAGVPTGAAGVNVTILSGHTINLRTQTGVLNELGTINVQGMLAINSGVTLNVNSGGLLQSSGIITQSGALNCNAGGTYRHNRDGGTIPPASWSSTSTCEIIGMTSSMLLSGLAQPFGNFTWNCPDQFHDVNLGSDFTIVKGNLSVASTGSALVRLNTNASTVTVTGGYDQSGGHVVAKTGSSGTGILTVKGFSLSGGMFEMTVTATKSVLNVEGDFSVTGTGLFTRSSTSTAAVNFNGSNPQHFTNSGSMQGAINYIVNSGASLLMGTNRLTGSGDFTLSDGGRLGIGDPNGITLSQTASGNIQVTGARGFGAIASYTYNGTVPQVTGSGLPTTLTGNVTSANNAGLTLTAHNETINSPGGFVVDNGALMNMGTNVISGTGTFTLASGATLCIGHTNGINGNITLSGNTNFSSGANYIYNGTTPQATGALLPPTINSLTVNNTGGMVTLGRVTTVTTSVTLASGAVLSLPSGTSTAATLWIAGVKEAPGTWGTTGSGATNIDSTHFAGTGVLNVTSGPTSSTALVSSLNPSTYGSCLTFTATVTGAGPTPTGIVTFEEGNTILGTSTLDASGVATFVTSTLSVVGSPHSITAVYGGDSNFGGSASSAVAQTVNKANPNVTTWPMASGITYGQALSACSLSGGVASAPGGFAFTTPSMTPNPGICNASVTFNPTDTDDCNSASSTVNVIVSPRTVNLTGARVYDGTITVVAGTLSVANKVGNDAVAVVSGSGTLSSKDVGSATITSVGSLALGGTAAGNYTLVGASGSVAIGKAPLSITAANDTKVYGESRTYGPGSTAFTSSGLQPDETVGSVTITANGGTEPTANAGSYALNPSDAAGGTFRAGNYDITYHPGGLEVLALLSGKSDTATLSDYLGDTIPAVFVATDARGMAVRTNRVQLTTSDGGKSFTYSIAVPTNTARISIKPRFYLRKTFTVLTTIATDNTVNLDLIGTPFIGGDADGNNQVDGNDYAWIRAVWGTTSALYDINKDGTVDANDFPDLNGDGVINAHDYSILKGGWYQSGDPE